MSLFDPNPFDLVPAMPSETVRVRATVSYLGVGFHGFAPQGSGIRTVGGVLVDALSRVLGHAVELGIAGRTDKGVHARGQVISFDARADADLTTLQRAVNKMLGSTIVVSGLAPADPDFHARFSARQRSYRYTVLNRAEPDPFLAATSWHVEKPLDLRAMQAGCDPLIGTHDFAAFCRRPEPGASLTRKVLDAHWSADGEALVFEISAMSFCHQMVRSLVGLLVEVGLGKRTAADVGTILRSADRSKAPSPAPPHGLCLWEVGY